MNFKKALKDIEDAQEQFFDGLISSDELEEQIKIAGEKYFIKTYCGNAVENLIVKLLKEVK